MAGIGLKADLCVRFQEMILEIFIKFIDWRDNKRYHSGDQKQRAALADLRPGLVDFFR